MGNTLEAPITEKTTCASSSEDKFLQWGTSSMQGYRISMEDAHISEGLELLPMENANSNIIPPKHYLFCVFDGHGGDLAAHYCRDNFVRVLYSQPTFQQYISQLLVSSQQQSSSKRKTKKNGNKNNKSNTNNARRSTTKRRDEEETERCSRILLERAMEDTFITLDFEFLKESIDQGMYQPPQQEEEHNNTPFNDNDTEDWGAFAETEEIHSNETTTSSLLSSQNHRGEDLPGTTALAVLITPEYIICANAGDSRAVLAASSTTEIIPLSCDHKPDLPQEKERIERAARGAVSTVFGGRVDGELAVSRALGDFGFKNYPRRIEKNDVMNWEDARQLAQNLKVSPFPEITSRDRRTSSDNNDARILILACDGIWDVMSNESCLDLTQTLMKEGESKMCLIAEEILDHCLKKGSRDNMTITVVKFPSQDIGNGGGVAKRRRQRERGE
mmetsp:Transcript_17482/g.26463  ORF Transcript_17482/g.26463 Transcript_17482/m.26463 type:complete len:445 (-) Transcript_17482:480-1814(-)|eukprot:CAMPEP_0194207090 /NCGR_PEP_ID=MMETSP0156-20130528/5947_1 /TAXON_ID=33649 /ORGANISM="Thalassionema nitzschioides, Strain L26-B" /LENGTH=444 /DNA_ID=CAMNT_0038933781 /DNA_START=85 /DNA_END=1419 /DNA_ORIENTATION=-